MSHLVPSRFGICVQDHTVTDTHDRIEYCLFPVDPSLATPIWMDRLDQPTFPPITVPSNATPYGKSTNDNNKQSVLQKYQDSIDEHDMGDDEDKANFYSNANQAQQSTLNTAAGSKLIPDSLHAFLGLQAQATSPTTNHIGDFLKR